MNRPWPRLIAILSVLLFVIASNAPAKEREVRDIKWKNADKDGAADVSIPPDGGFRNVLKLEKPGVKEPSYAIRGDISYSGVKETGYLEMWNYFEDGGYFFTRTLGDTGPMGSIKGDSDWREFVLPFNAKKGMVLKRIEVNVVLPGGGKVKLKPAKLLEYTPKEPATQSAAPAGEKSFSPPAQAGAWWGGNKGGWFGSVFGSIIGMCGGLIGMLAARGRGRRFALSLMITIIIVGGMMLIAGLIAATVGQPYAVWYPLLLCGGLGGVLMACLLPSIKRRYDEHELRRMSAMDAVAS